MEFKTLREANLLRQEEWVTSDEKLSITFKATELAGEVGEACNIVKKLERKRLGIATSEASLLDLAEELADVMICVDLLAAETGIDLDEAVKNKFNKTSDKYGLSVKIG